jgi:hypothetical protein
MIQHCISAWLSVFCSVFLGVLLLFLSVDHALPALITHEAAPGLSNALSHPVPYCRLLSPVPTANYVFTQRLKLKWIRNDLQVKCELLRWRSQTHTALQPHCDRMHAANKALEDGEIDDDVAPEPQVCKSKRKILLSTRHGCFWAWDYTCMRPRWRLAACSTSGRSSAFRRRHATSRRPSRV